MSGLRLRRTSRRPIALAAAVALLFAASLAAQEKRPDHSRFTAGRLSTLCRSGQAADSSTLRQRREDLGAQLRANPADTALWHAFACVLSLQYALSPGGAGTITTLAMPAIRAWAHLLADDPADSVGATGLATLAFDLAGGPGLPNAIVNADGFASLAYAAVRAGVTAPIVFRLCTEFAFLTSDVATARYCNHRALATGRDSTWQLIRSAWFAYLNDDRRTGAAQFDRAIAVAHDSISLSEAEWHAARLAGGALPSGWTALNDSSRVAWMHANIVNSSALAEPYAVVLSRFEGDVPEHGPMFASCPFDVIRNGMHVAVDRRLCRVPTAPVRRIDVAADLMRLWDPASGQPIAIVTYAFDHSALTVNTTADARVATVQLEWRIWAEQSSEWTDSSLEVRLPMVNDLLAPRFVSGYLLVKPPHGMYSWTLFVRQPGRSGQRTGDAAVAPADSSFVLSDLVLGVPEQGLSWQLGADTVYLAPWNVVPRHKLLELYFQLRNTAVNGAFTTRIVLRRISAGTIDSVPELSISFPLTARIGIEPMHRQLDLARFPGTSHHLEVQVLDPHGSVAASSSANLFIQ